MKTGDIQNNVRILETELRRIHYPHFVDAEAVLIGKPESLLPVIHYVILGFSHSLTEHFTAKMEGDLYANNDLRFMQKVYKLLLSEFKFKPKLTIDQFFTITGFAELKIILVVEIIRLCLKTCRDLNRLQKKRGVITSSTSYNPKRNIRVNRNCKTAEELGEKKYTKEKSPSSSGEYDFRAKNTANVDFQENFDALPAELVPQPQRPPVMKSLLASPKGGDKYGKVPQQMEEGLSSNQTEISNPYNTKRHDLPVVPDHAHLSVEGPVSSTGPEYEELRNTVCHLQTDLKQSTEKVEELTALVKKLTENIEFLEIKCDTLNSTLEHERSQKQNIENSSIQEKQELEDVSGNAQNDKAENEDSNKEEEKESPSEFKKNSPAKDLSSNDNCNELEETTPSKSPDPCPFIENRRKSVEMVLYNESKINDTQNFIDKIAQRMQETTNMLNEGRSRAPFRPMSNNGQSGKQVAQTEREKVGKSEPNMHNMHPLNRENLPKRENGNWFGKIGNVYST
eukprot:Nk52_evm2s490 gene=Nk52_evmTU2s490